MYVNFLSTYSDKKSCHTSTTLQTSIARFVSDAGLSAIAELLVLFLRTQKSWHGPRAQAVEPILTCDTPKDAYSHRAVLFGGFILTSSLKNPPKHHFWAHNNGKPMGNTYSHNCMRYDAEI